MSARSRRRPHPRSNDSHAARDRGAHAVGDRGAHAAPRASTAGVAPHPPAAMALWIALATLAIARAVASGLPGTWAWGLASLQFVPPAAILLWAVATLALIPAVGRAATPALAAVGDAWTAPARRAWLAMALFAASFAALAWALEDRGFFVGDFVLRLGIIRKSVPYARMFPQALPLDTLIHERLIGALAAVLNADPLTLERVLGAARAASLALLGVALARTLECRGAAAAAVAIVAATTGALGLSTGYAKGLADLALAVMAVGVLGLGVARGRGGLAALGVATALALALHRSGFALLVPWAAALVLARRHGTLSATRPGAWAALAAPPLAALAMLSRVTRLLMTFDRPHLMPAGSGLTGALIAAFEPHHLCDAANALVWTSPLAPAALTLALSARPGRRAPDRRSDGIFLAALVAPWILELLLVHPQQGMVRDWDVFVPAAVAIAVAAAAGIGAVVGSVPARRWLAVPAMLAALAPIGALLLRAHDAQRSLEFADALIEGPPRRSVPERASLHQYRAILLARDRRYAQGAAEFRQAAELAPSPAALTLWLDSALLARNGPMARDALATIAERDPTPAHLLQLSRMELALRHLDAALEAAQRALDLAPADPACVAWADSLKALRGGR